MITSQIEKRKNYYKNNLKALESLIEVSPEEISILSKPSLIDCNQPEFILKSKLDSIFDPDGPFKIYPEIPTYIREKIITCIKRSPIVKPYYKNLLPDI